jgi:hypothetical protein
MGGRTGLDVLEKMKTKLPLPGFEFPPVQSVSIFPILTVLLRFFEKLSCVRSRVFTAVKIYSVVVFWFMKRCSLRGDYRRFGRNIHLKTLKLRGANIGPASKFRPPTILLLLIVRNEELRDWVILQCHNVGTFSVIMLVPPVSLC